MRSRAAHQDDQFHQTLAAHQHANGEALPPLQLHTPGGQRAAENLSSESACDDANNVRPGNSIIQQTQIGAQSGQGKVQGQK